jgi:predicted DNA-binding protein with PD1-like motif
MRPSPFLCFTALMIAISCGHHGGEGFPRDKYVRTSAGYTVVLRQGDEALTQLKALAIQENLQGGSITGLGFGHATFGYFNRETKRYDPREFRDVELASLTGSIAWQQGQPSLHVHAVATASDFVAHGGHLLRFEVGTGSLELHVVDAGAPLKRKRDEALGADILDVSRP